MTGVSFLVDLQAEVVFVDATVATGLIRLSTGAGITQDWTLAEIAGVNLCTRPEGCVCAPNTASGAIEFQQIQPGIQRLGLTGGLQGATLHIAGQRLEDFCGTCFLGTWEMDNDSYVPLELVAPAPAGTNPDTPLGTYGHVQLHFREDGFWQLTINSLYSHYNGPKGENGMPFIELKTNGVLRGTYEYQPVGADAFIVTLTVAESTATTRHRTMLGRNPDGTRTVVDSSTPPVHPLGALGGAVEIRCGQDTMTLALPTGGGAVPLRFGRHS